ncbi:MAG: hypothetical protein QNJ51_09170 [Calothrix sp. MO_167.B12]|nr:hypothetical protein [Calothrix sp. MO_167.B12]
MFNKGNFSLFIVLLLIFIGFGDSFLPKPLSTASFQTRTTINNFVVGIFPTWEPKTKRYERTEKALEEAQKGRQAN